MPKTASKPDLQGTLFDRLNQDEQQFIHKALSEYNLSYQESRQLCQDVMDYRMWSAGGFESLWNEQRPEEGADRQQLKKRHLQGIRAAFERVNSRAVVYNKNEAQKIKAPRLDFSREERNNKVLGICAAESPKTVCCNLRTIDAVRGCAFSCSYCTIQTFYNTKVTFEPKLQEKLDAMDLDPHHRYHMGTGQSSDSLVWGNREGSLDALMAFAEKWPNVMLEFKTKSNNINYFKDKAFPRNLLFTWSLNPDEVVQNEEHLTATLDDRLQAARTMADRGFLVGFHFHPMIWYEGWEKGYSETVAKVKALFSPEEIGFISMGAITFIKPVIKSIRKKGIPSKMTQHAFTQNPEGKLTYQEEVKTQMFRHLYQSFSEWHGRVFFYICMEKEYFWHKTFGWSYPTNEQFEEDILDHLFAKAGIEKKPGTKKAGNLDAERAAWNDGRAFKKSVPDTI